jgi:hypothetical protein
MQAHKEIRGIYLYYFSTSAPEVGWGKMVNSTPRRFYSQEALKDTCKKVRIQERTKDLGWMR